MVQSSIVRRLGSKFFDVIDHVLEMDIPAEGMPLRAFALDLPGVPPNHGEEVAHALARKGVVWIGNHGGVRKVFKAKPEGLSWRTEADPIDDVVARFAPHAGAIAKALRAEVAATSTADKIAARAGIEAAAKRALKEVAKALARGLPLGDLRSALHAVFHPDIVDALSRVDPALKRQSEAQQLSELRAYPRREAGPKISIYERVATEIERRGADGASRTDLLQGLHPRINAAVLTDALERLEADGLIDSIDMLAPRAYRKALRYFRPGTLPQLDGHGRAMRPA